MPTARGRQRTLAWPRRSARFAACSCMSFALVSVLSCAWRRFPCFSFQPQNSVPRAKSLPLVRKLAIGETADFSTTEADEEEADRILQRLEAQGRQVAEDQLEGSEEVKYQPSTDPSDPIVAALRAVCNVSAVSRFELLDSRWNGNEAMRYDADDGRSFFIKMNRVEDTSVFMAEAVGLSALLKAASGLKVPKPLHLGRLPKVGSIGPGAFMVLEWLQLMPFGIMRKDKQAELGQKLAELHLNSVHDDLHKGRFGFPVSNFLALTPLDNTWCDTWEELFRRRLSDQISRLYVDKAYGRAALYPDDRELADNGARMIAALPRLLALPADTRPSLIHGDLWMGNAGATKDAAVIFDPACCFAHHEFELAITDMFGGFEAPFWDAYFERIPRAAGFETRQKVYQLRS
ncbi:unnamed protein product [Polarella glacialis]|uniref:protein-ribulosamine 3-kinase n=1 Tax=Polarella glacialis TaxID=89957 RepID=A0A813H0P3_POLGL|nr:unnamed protein product [Polarella glacialis]CAE8631286.1 unnamed protein product [Polarella glacialis]CAE8637713.1 unnamed protein product [Polarella glacialis]CAE8714176.1 unnamed protein product [Polarella glacialis]